MDRHTRHVILQMRERERGRKRGREREKERKRERKEGSVRIRVRNVERKFFDLLCVDDDVGSLSPTWSSASSSEEE
jgi:hypothetical protein